MRNAEDFVREYRKRGYTDERIRVIANLTREPLRGEVLSILDSGREIDLTDPVPAEEQAKPQHAKEAAPVAAQEVTALGSRGETLIASPRTSPPEVKPVRQPADDPAELKKLNSQLAQAQRDRVRLEKEIEDHKVLIAEFKKGTERVAAITRQLDEARGDIEQAREQEAEKQAALEAAIKERRDAQQKVEEFAEKIAESDSTITALQERVAQQERQLKEIRVRSEQDSARLRRESDLEARNLRRQVGTYKRVATGAAIAAVLLLTVALIMPHRTVGHMPKPPSSGDGGTAALAQAASHDATSQTSIAAAPVAHSTDGAQMVSATTFTDTNAPSVGLTAPAPSGAILTGVTTGGAEAGATAKSATESAKANAKAQQAGPATVYTVKKYDSLWKIAKEQLGDANRASDIARENNITLKAVLRIGMKLKLPAKTTAAPTNM